MNSRIYINSILENEKNIFFINKNSESGFWDNTIFGLINLIRYRDKDYFLITDKRIVCLIKNILIKNSKYSDFSKIKFNSNDDSLWFFDDEGKEQRLNLRGMRLSYEEIQKLKKTLN